MMQVNKTHEGLVLYVKTFQLTARVVDGRVEQWDEISHENEVGMKGNAIEARLDAEGYDPSTQKHGCCDPPLE